MIFPQPIAHLPAGMGKGANIVFAFVEHPKLLRVIEFVQFKSAFYTGFPVAAKTDITGLLKFVAGHKFFVDRVIHLLLIRSSRTKYTPIGRL